jgi:hypothetical protein
LLIVRRGTIRGGEAQLRLKVEKHVGINTGKLRDLLPDPVDSIEHRQLAQRTFVIWRLSLNDAIPPSLFYSREQSRSL